MAAPKSSSRGHPGRVLAFIGVVIVALYAIMFSTGDKTPRLGIDLAGGTSVTLTAKADQGRNGAVNKSNMQTAVEIIRQRVNAFGVSEAEVQTEGDRNIVISIPKGKNEKETAEQVGQTAKLFFRPVLEATQITPQGGTKLPLTPPSTPPASTPPASTPPAAESGKPQGRVIPNLKDASGAPTPPPSTPPASTPPATPPASTPPAGADANGITPELRAKYNNLDCSLPENRGLGPVPAPEDQPTVACSRDQGEGEEKYILGRVLIPGTDVASSKAQLPQNGSVGGWEVELKFTDAGADKFTKITGDLAANKYPTNRFAIDLDGVVVSAPSVKAEIPGGSAVISGNFTRSSAKDLENVLKYGALPLSFTKSDVTTVSASLGGDQLRGGLIAGAIGIVLVILYSLFYYRGLGLVSIASLAVSAALTYAIMCLLGRSIGFALNLPAVCGAIAAIGITVDSFIVYFERIRDEIREGRTLRPAVEKAWPRARRTILVSDAVSFLAAAVLYVVSVGKVQGFAFTLGLTTLLDVVVVFLFTKPLMTILAKRKFFADGHKWSGLDPEALGANQRQSYRSRRPRGRAAGVKEA
ncbi:protein translocase subunit SecD [Embleya scabrispora]|uniref:protein translocase subunit SecD n=1 Tax=Embleya scabrispora TaxID=159449 RepID=UPI0003A8F09C|nr:protein translocase subunit SecD [Embleya scabrispora]MYS78996.1 protein translocase subunit SecD [Streptomyces sp. SID5474]